MSRYRRGAEAERHLVLQLRADGYYATRAASSKGAADIIAIKPGQVLFIQVKAGAGRESPAERRALLDLAACLPHVGVPVVAENPQRRDGRLWRLTGTGPRQREPFTVDALGDAP